MSSVYWGGATKVYTASRDKYEALTDSESGVPEAFPRFVDVFNFAAALGIARGQRQPFSKDGPEILNMYSVDAEGVLGPLLMALHPNAPSQERYHMLLEYAEWGVNILWNEWKATGTVDPAAYIDE